MPSINRLPLDGSSFLHRTSNTILPNLYGEVLRGELTSAESSASKALEKLRSKDGPNKDNFSQSRYDFELWHIPPNVTLDESIIAGRFAFFEKAWLALTNDPWVLKCVQGYTFPFEKNPPLSRVSKIKAKRGALSDLGDKEVELLIQKQILEEIPSDSEVFSSPFFAVPKKDHKIRLVINLRALNKYLSVDSFKMEGLSLVPEVVKKGDFCAKIDMREAFFAVKIHPKYRKYLAIVWKDRVFNTHLCASVWRQPLTCTRA